MTKQRLPLVFVITMLLAGYAMPVTAAAPPKEPATRVTKAGSITALLPVAQIVRGAGRTAVTTEAKKGDDVAWNDLVKTLRGGRARITLSDQSILSLGSQAELRVVRHDTASQQTALQLGYGRLRAEVTRITRQGGSFELRTPTAVAGVIGTDFGADSSSVGTTTFVCISGAVQVSNIDPNIAGSVQCAPGMTTSVSTGKPPTPPANATPGQIQQLILETEPAIVTAMSPMNALPGATLDTTITGTKLTGINKVTASGKGLQVGISGTPTDTSMVIHMVVAADAAPGPYTISMSKPSGASSAAVFTILSPPTPAQAGTDPKKSYHDLFEQERQSTRAGLGAFLAGVQQAADIAGQQLQNANSGNVDLSQATGGLAAQVATVQSAITSAGSAVDGATTTAVTSFDTQFDSAWKSLLQRSPGGVPDNTFNQAVQALFQQTNSNLGEQYNGIRSNLAATVQTASANIAQVQQTWMTTVTAAGQQPPTPAINTAERSIDVGAAFGSGGIATIDASNSKAARGATVVSYKWTLCDPAYKPANFGVPIPPNTQGCNAVPGYGSTTADFPLATCNLTPADYIARLTITDSNNVSSAMDVKVHVLPPTYDDPATRFRNLAAAYSTLQLQQFLAFFDENNFPGFTALSENARNTFPGLGSMNINLRMSQAAISCNDATVRADWQQNYTFKQVCQNFAVGTQTVQACSDPNVPFSQTEQLSARMVRTPGKGWFITDFQGDNGKVQGVPVIVSPDTAAPDLLISSVSAGGGGILATGDQTVYAHVINLGSADVTQNTTVQFVLYKQSDGTQLAVATANVAAPIAANGGTTDVSAVLSVASLAGGTAVRLVATVDPACNITPTEQRCDNNSFTQAMQIGTPVQLTQVGSLALLSAGPAQTLSLQVSAPATLSISLPPGVSLVDPTKATVTLAAAGTATWDLVASLSAVPGANLTNMTVYTIGSPVPVSLPITYSVTGQANYKILSAAFQGHIGTLTGSDAVQTDEVLTLVVTIYNEGNVTQTGDITVTATCTPVSTTTTGSGTCSGGGNPTATIAAPAAGASATATMTFSNGLAPGSYTGTVTLTTPLPQKTTADDTYTVPFEDVDFQLLLQQPFTGTQMLLRGNSGQVAAKYLLAGTNTPFNIPMTISGAYTGVTYTPAVVNVAPSTVQTFSVVSSTTSPTGTFTVTIGGTNHGVTRSVTQDVTILFEQLVSTNLFLNDASNPLEIQLGATAPQVVSLKLQGSTFTGDATLLSPPTSLGFNTTMFPATVTANGTFDWQITANSSATSNVIPLTLTAQLPNASPANSAQVQYPLYVKAISVPDLQIVSVPLPAALSTNPWIDGQGVDFVVTVKNAGLSTSQGGELVSIKLDKQPVGEATVGPLGPGASTPVTVHCVAPDLHGTSAFTGTGNLSVRVDPDPAGDLNYADNTATLTVPLANWHVAIAGTGTQSSPLVLEYQVISSATANFAGSVDGGSISTYTPSMFTAVSGSASSGAFISPINFSSPVSFSGTVNLPGSATTLSGPYYAQLIMQVTDGGKVTAQRQATVWINFTNANAVASLLSSVSLASSANNCSGANCTTTGSTVQVNGGLTEQVSLTLTMMCTSAVANLPFPCANASASLAFQDAFNTNTSPASVTTLATGTPVTVQISAAMDSRGEVLVGPATNYLVGINGIQHSAKRGTTATSPDAVGFQVPFSYNVGDLDVVSNLPAKCASLPPNSPTPFTVTPTWSPLNGFNVPTLFWEIEDSNHIPVGSAPVGFSIANGSSTFSGGNYSALPTITLTNTQPQDGLLQYFFAVTISNSVTSATKYFPFYVDASISQNFCGASPGGARGYTRMQGTWSRIEAGSGGPVALSTRSSISREGTSGATPDLRVATSDISYTPSIPKVGDTLQVRFRVRNEGTGRAVGVPIALQVNGKTVASDTFDVPAEGTALGGLEWNTADSAVRRPIASQRRMAMRGRVDPESFAEAVPQPQTAVPVLVIDPQHTLQQKTTLEKSAPLPHFSLRNAAAATTAATAAAGSQRILLEIEEGACIGLRLATGGTMPCGTSEVELTAEDLAKTLLMLNTMSGVADMGMAFGPAQSSARLDSAQLAGARFSAQSAALAGHSYAVQLSDGRTALVTFESVRNPRELDAKARAAFRRSAARVLRKLGQDSGPQDPGDLTGNSTSPTVFVTMVVQTP